MSEPYLIAVGLAAVFVLVAANGLFVATEFAYVAVRRTRVEQLAAQGRGRARLLLASLHDLDDYLAATQLGITMSSLALGWIGEPALARLVEPAAGWLVGSWAAEAVSHTVSVAVAFTLITTLHIVLGELAPKTLALQRPEATALTVACLWRSSIASSGPSCGRSTGRGGWSSPSPASLPGVNTKYRCRPRSSRW